MQVTINEIPLARVKEKRILRIVIDEQLSFTPHVELTTKKCRSAYNGLPLYSDLAPNMAIQLYKAYIRSRLEYGCIIWVYKIRQKNHMNKLQSTQRSALSLTLRTMKSTPADSIGAELPVTSIDLCHEELQRHEAIKMHRDPDSYFIYKMNKTTKSTSKQSPCKHLQSILKQLLKKVSPSKKLHRSRKT